MARRRLLNLLTAGSAVLCVVVAVLWARSYLPEDVRFGVADGRVVVLFTRDIHTASPRYFPQTAEGYRSGLHVGLRGLLRELYAGRAPFPTDVGKGEQTRVSAARGPGFACVAQTGIVDPRWWACGIAVHLGWILAAALVLPAWRAASWLRARRRAARSLCVICGYDIRATPARCPECGHVPTIAAPTPT